MIVCGLETSLRTRSMWTIKWVCICRQWKESMDHMSLQTIRTVSEQVRMLYSCILTQRENSRRNKKWEDGGERHFVPHKCGSYLQKKHICVLWWECSHSLGGTKHLSPSLGGALRKANHFTTKQVFVAEVRHVYWIKIKMERGSHRHTSFGLQQGIDSKTNHRKKKI